MATAEQIKTLIRSHLNENSEQFITTVLQVAAHEARKGYTDLAQELRSIVDEAKKRKPTIAKFPGQLDELIHSERVEIPLHALVVDGTTRTRLQRIALEFRQRSKLKTHGLTHRRKILLTGPPGTGKTMTARVLSTQLRQPLHIVQMDRLVTKFMGETSAKLRQVFDRILRISGVYLFDEFDAIGGERDQGNDVGEMRRVLTSFLQFIENDMSDNLILAATNNPQLLDKALFRRFDDVLFYTLPGEEERTELIANVLAAFHDPCLPLKKAVAATAGLSHAEITRAIQDSMKTAVLSDEKYVTTSNLLAHIKERREIYERREE